MNPLRGDQSVRSDGDGNWYYEFADKLISENFLLTALEFHAELIESGRELPRLKNFFSNPGNFENLATNKPEVVYSASLPRSSSQATLDSLDLTRYSEDGERSNDDRVAVLEFELRKARETIIALRANLTVAAETETKQKSQEKSKDVEDLIIAQKSIIKPHEQRALNFLINEYLLLHGYKLTSITFSDENESQDFDDWDDVGLNIGRPVELLSLYREGLKASGYSSNFFTKDFNCQVSLDNELQENLKSEVNKLESEVASLTGKLELLNSKSLKNLCIENQENVGSDSHISLSPDHENFEIIENVKPREEFETKSDKFIGDWTKVEDKLKGNKIDIRCDIEPSTFEVLSSDTKDQATLFEDFSATSEALCKDERNDLYGNKCELPNVHEIKSIINLPENMIEALDFEITYKNQRKEKDIDQVFEKDSVYSFFSYIDNVTNSTDRFRDQFLNYCDMNIPICNSHKVFSEWFKQMSPSYLTVHQIVDILSESLPRIVPNVILNKREEIAPLLVLTICLNSDSSVRDKLLNLLFNLKKKPQEDERRAILSTLLVIAQFMGSSMVESEILPQCWEQITHKYVERRMLVSESCFFLAPYVSEAIRNSLVLSIVKQLLEDREENVRKSAVNVLALLVTLMSDENKYPQIVDISLNILSDESSEVADSVIHVLWPVLAEWSLCLKQIQAHLFAELLCKLKKKKDIRIVRVMQTLLPFLIISVAESRLSLKDSLNDELSSSERQEFFNLCKGLSNPFTFYKGSINNIFGTLDFYTADTEFETCNWPELNWILEVYIPVLLDMGNASWEDHNFIMELVVCFRYFCIGLGKTITRYKIKPFLLKKLQECENFILVGEQWHYLIMPMLLIGVLSIDGEGHHEIDITLRKFIYVLPLCGATLMPLQVTIELLSRYETCHNVVLDCLWEGVTHQRSAVRSTSAKLFQCVIHNVPESLISARVLPALITLSSDPEISVKTSSIPALGMLTKCKDKEIKDKVYLTLQSFLQNTNVNNHLLVIQFVRTIETIYENCDQHFREEVIVPQLFSIATHYSHNKSIDLVEVLTEVFATISFSQSHLSYHCISNALLPGLRCLENACIHLSLPFKDRIDSMIKEVDRRGATSRDTSGNSLVTSPTSEIKRYIPNSGTTQVVVEDVKNKVTKIFHTKPNSLQNVSAIFKKKS